MRVGQARRLKNRPGTKLRNYLRFRLGLLLILGAVLASVLCFQCVRTYLYTDSVLVPQQAEREAERQAGALTLAARRANALGVGLLSGGYGQDELERAGAYRVYQDPADLLRHLDEVGVRPAE